MARDVLVKGPGHIWAVVDPAQLIDRQVHLAHVAIAPEQPAGFHAGCEIDADERHEIVLRPRADWVGWPRRQPEAGVDSRRRGGRPLYWQRAQQLLAGRQLALDRRAVGRAGGVRVAPAV